MMRLLASLAVLYLLTAPAITAAAERDAALRDALRDALASWPAVTKHAADPASLARRLRKDRETLARLRERRATLDDRLADLTAQIEILEDRLVADPNAMRTPRDQVTLVALQDQRETTRQFRNALDQSIRALRHEVARTEVRRLAVEGGRAALEARLAQLTP